MADKLIERLDRFVTTLLDDAEVRCPPTPSDDTSEAEDGSGSLPRTASLSERTAILKACTAYIAMRDKKGGTAKPDDDEPEDEPEIVRLERRLQRRGRR
jgi:hypothetical protein